MYLKLALLALVLYFLFYDLNLKELFEDTAYVPLVIENGNLSSSDPKHNLNYSKEFITWDTQAEKNPWLSVDMKAIRLITRIESGYDINNNKGVKRYYLSYSTGGKAPTDYMEDNEVKIFDNPDDQNLIHEMQNPFLADKVMLHPVTWKNNILVNFKLYYNDFVGITELNELNKLASDLMGSPENIEAKNAFCKKFAETKKDLIMNGDEKDQKYHDMFSQTPVYSSFEKECLARPLVKLYLEDAKLARQEEELKKNPGNLSPEELVAQLDEIRAKRQDLKNQQSAIINPGVYFGDVTGTVSGSGPVVSAGGVYDLGRGITTGTVPYHTHANAVQRVPPHSHGPSGNIIYNNIGAVPQHSHGSGGSSGNTITSTGL